MRASVFFVIIEEDISIYSGLKCDAITYEEYKSHTQYEARQDEYYSSRKDEYFDGDCFDGEDDDDEDCW